MATNISRIATRAAQDAGWRHATDHLDHVIGVASAPHRGWSDNLLVNTPGNTPDSYGQIWKPTEGYLILEVFSGRGSYRAHLKPEVEYYSVSENGNGFLEGFALVAEGNINGKTPATTDLLGAKASNGSFILERLCKVLAGRDDFVARKVGKFSKNEIRNLAVGKVAIVVAA